MKIIFKIFFNITKIFCKSEKQLLFLSNMHIQFNISLNNFES